MKKIILVLFSLGLFITSANAGINGACKLANVYPGSGPALKAYCWNIAYLSSTLHPSWEDVIQKVAGVYDHGGAIYVKVDVFGNGDKTSATLDDKSMTLVKTENIINSFKLLIGQRYWYQKTDNTLPYGLIKVKNYSTMQDRVNFI
ncbi:hypothetical protein L5F46_10965 [Aliarcobacter butzleri]|uniref:hypothetical protein n=1 Tax=Aliarcobacter butzleri TaxID=28197 RepID=UPI001EE02D08|nr:hypothetical protein [Aliarcobacter butzleri]MCG3675292.1 hypothetical protein [Aliarcobacter butzleri]